MVQTNHSPQLQSLFTHLIVRNDGAGVEKILAYLAELPNNRIDWHDLVPGYNSLASLVAIYSREAPTKRADMSQSTQKLMADLWKRDGVEIKPDHRVVELAVKHHFCDLVARLFETQGWNQSHPGQFLNTLKGSTYEDLLVLRKSWEDRPELMAELGLAIDHHLENGWVNPSCPIKTMELLRKDRSWQPQEASRYVVERLLPQWKEKTTDYTHITVAANPSLSNNAVAAFLMVEPTTWTEHVFTLPYMDWQAKLLPAITLSMQSFGMPGKEIPFPLPSLDWIDQDIVFHQNKELGKNEDGSKGWIRTMSRMCLDVVKENPQKLDWHYLARAMAYNNAYADKKRVGPNITKVLDLCWNSGADPAVPDIGNADLDLMAIGAWIGTVPLDNLEKLLGPWSQLHTPKLDQAPVVDMNFHEHITHACLGRIRKEAQASRNVESPVLVNTFWTHLLWAIRGGSQRFSSLGEELIRNNIPGQEQIWNIGSNPELAELLRDDVFIQQIDQRKGYSQGMMTVLLKLKTQVMPQINRLSAPRAKM